MPDFPQLPDCFCDGLETCDYWIKVDMTFGQHGDERGARNSVEWQLNSIPQVVAQVIFQTTIKVVNENGADVYLAWLEACLGEDHPEVQAARKLLPTMENA